MSLYVLDTDTLTLYRQGHTLVCQRVTSQKAEDLAITVMSVEEQLSGWYSLLRRAKQRKQVARVYQELVSSVQFLGAWRILPFPESAMTRCDKLIALRLQVRKMDLRIAAISLENAGTLVTRNLRDFQRVPGLVVENWAV
jgi:tRNA(fMet)-specific endonuclease VapC